MTEHADIVERLRAIAPEGMLSRQVSDLGTLRDAADEIERLRTALRKLSWWLLEWDSTGNVASLWDDPDSGMPPREKVKRQPMPTFT